MGGVKRGLLLAVVSAAVVAGCGSEREEPSAPDLPPLGPTVEAASVTGPPLTDPAELARRLLGPADLPGMTPVLDARTPGQAQTAGPTAQTRPAHCAQVLLPLAEQGTEPLTWNTVAYNGPSFSSIDIDAASYAPEKLSDAFSAVQRTLRECTEYSGNDADGTSIEYRLGGLAQPSVGDASTAFQLRTSSAGFTLVSVASIVQVGSVLAQVTITAPESVEPAALTELTADQVDRLRGVAGP
ncbi:hypothetical protein [Nocardia amikacinitolerans]|uniref:hypothetical protein n=1 Tax=Nocardia amikacinitolerans TaxID=756689 RepID=UPI0020A24CE4|nr:hypothetical protein [Nocardia amikacinitolerans]